MLCCIWVTNSSFPTLTLNISIHISPLKVYALNLFTEIHCIKFGCVLIWNCQPCFNDHPVFLTQIIITHAFLHLLRLQECSAHTSTGLFPSDWIGTPVEALKRLMPVVSAMWHEAVRGRKAPEVTSAWLRILMEHRNHRAITVWSDSCLGQNKNYVLYTALAQLVNSEEVAFNSITLKYFEHGECNIYMDKHTICSFAT